MALRALPAGMALPLTVEQGAANGPPQPRRAPTTPFLRYLFPGWMPFPLTFPPASIAPPCLTITIQDRLHLVLILGLASTGVFLLTELIMIFSSMECNSPLCVEQWVCTFLVLPSMAEFIRFASDYRQSLREELVNVQVEAQRSHDAAVEAFDRMKANLGECANTAQYATQMLFRRYSSDMETFFRHILARYRDLYVSEEILEELRRYLVAWLLVFRQTLLVCPDWLNEEQLTEEFRRATTVESLCELAVDCLTKRLPVVSTLVSFERGAGDLDPRPPSEREEEVRVIDCHCPPERPRVQWPAEGHYPATVSCGACSVRVLSEGHTRNMLYLLLDVGLALFVTFQREWRILVLLGINTVCIAVMFVSYKRMAAIDDLRAQANFHERCTNTIQERSNKLEEEWQELKRNHKKWVGLTLPSLEIMECVTKHLGDMEHTLREGQYRGTQVADDRQPRLRDFNDAWGRVCADLQQVSTEGIQMWDGSVTQLTRLESQVQARLAEAGDQSYGDKMQRATSMVLALSGALTVGRAAALT